MQLMRGERLSSISHIDSGRDTAIKGTTIRDRGLERRRLAIDVPLSCECLQMWLLNQRLGRYNFHFYLPSLRYLTYTYLQGNSAITCRASLRLRIWPKSAHILLTARLRGSPAFAASTMTSRHRGPAGWSTGGGLPSSRNE